MATRLYKTITLLLLCLTVVSVPSLAWANTERADDLFKILDSGGTETQEQVTAYITELGNLIDPDDIVRQEKLLTHQCWNQVSDTEQEQIDALKFATEHEARYANKPISNTHLDLLLCKGYYLELSGQPEQALDTYTRGVDEGYKLENPKLIADGLSLRGAILSYQGNFSRAVEDLITAQSFYESLHYDYWSNSNLNQIATTYRRLGDPQTAILYFVKLEKAYSESGRNDEAIGVNAQIAFALEESGKHQDALKRFQDSYDYWGKKKNNLLQQIAAIHLAGSLIELRRIEEATSLLLAAGKDVKANDSNAFSYLHFNLAQAYFIQNKADLALTHLAVAEPAFKRSGDNRGLIKLHLLKADILASRSQWELAYTAQSEYLKLHLEQDKSTLSKQTTEMRTRFDSSKIEKENQLLIEKQQQKEKILQALQQNESLKTIVIVLVALILCIVTIFASIQVKRKIRFKRLALTDDLTKLANRRDSYAQANRLFVQAVKNGHTLSIVTFDIDHFKNVNDMWGHDVGDEVLIKLANICMKLMRNSDIIGRVGGEEFVVLLPNTNSEQALEVANRIVLSVANADWDELTPTKGQTISAGVATLTKESSLTQLLKKADQALYLAKSSGRNCVKQL